MGLHVVVDRCGSGVGRHDVVVFRRGLGVGWQVVEFRRGLGVGRHVVVFRRGEGMG